MRYPLTKQLIFSQVVSITQYTIAEYRSLVVILFVDEFSWAKKF